MQRGALRRSNGKIDLKEQRKVEITDQLRAIGKEDAVPALIRALKDPSAQMRQNAELTMIFLAGAYDAKPKVDIREAIPELIKATEDSDRDVRAWAAGALAEVGAGAKEAVPALVRLLGDSYEGSRNNSCIALRRIGSAASNALPALRNALNDPSSDVRRFARLAIEEIEK
jgi:HEAT repeat protein